MRNNGGVIFLRCSEEEAQTIRMAARAERRTISGFVLNAVLSRIEAKQKALQQTSIALPLRRTTAA